MGRSRSRKLAAGLIQKREHLADFQDGVSDRNPENGVDQYRSMHRFPPDSIFVLCAISLSIRAKTCFGCAASGQAASAP
jgi:hypothetical protein